MTATSASYPNSVQNKGALIAEGRTAEVFAWGEADVLKLFRAGWPETEIYLEAQIGRKVVDAGLAAPHVGDTIRLDGRLGIIYERIQGPSMLEDWMAKPWKLVKAARSMAELHAAMHECCRPELPNLKQGTAHALQAAASLPPSLREQALRQLDRLPDGEAVCHMDLHPANILLSARGPLVIDWMSVKAGDPLADVARTRLLVQYSALNPWMGAVQRRFIQAARRWFYSIYLEQYLTLRSGSRREIDAWLPVMAAARLAENIPGEEEVLLRLAENLP